MRNATDRNRRKSMTGALALSLIAPGLIGLAAAQSVQSRGVSQAQAAAAASRSAGSQAQRPAADAQKQPPAAAQKTAAAGAAQKAAETKSSVSSGTARDPFVSTIKVAKPGEAPQLTCPPGVRGIVVGQAELNGVARSATEAIAVITTTATGRTYFLREGNTLCNGRVKRITEDSITFEENAIDPLGKPIVREVIRKIPADAK